MIRKINHFVVVGVSILLAELVAKHLEHLIEPSKTANMSFYVLKVMAFTLAIYYPLLLLSEKLSEIIAHHLFAETKKMAGGRIGGLVMASLLCFALLFVAYYKTLSGKWPF